MLERLAFTSVTVAVASSCATAAVAEPEQVHDVPEPFGVEEATTSQVVSAGSAIAFRASGFAPGSLVVVRGITDEGFVIPVRRLLCDAEGNAIVSLVHHLPGELVLTAQGVTPGRQALTRSVRFTVLELEGAVPQGVTASGTGTESAAAGTGAAAGVTGANGSGSAVSGVAAESVAAQTASTSSLTVPASAGMWAGAGAAGIVGAVVTMGVVRRRTNVIRTR